MGEVVQLVLAAPQSLLLPQKVALALVGIRVLRYAGRRAGQGSAALCSLLSSQGNTITNLAAKPAPTTG
jgi:hypothetical protein